MRCTSVKAMLLVFLGFVELMDASQAFCAQEVEKKVLGSPVRALVQEMWSLLPQPHFEINARLRVRGSLDGKELFFETPGAGFNYRIDMLPERTHPNFLPVLRGNEYVYVGTGEWFAQDASVEIEFKSIRSRKSPTGFAFAPETLRYTGAAGWSFQSDEEYPLTFKQMKEGGVYLCGRGTITTPTGEVYRFGQNHAVDQWLPLMKSTSQLDREGAAQALGWLAKTQRDRDKTVSALVTALKDKAMEVRRDAAEALGRIGDARAMEPLTFMLKDESGWVRDVAKESLGLIRAKTPSE